MSIRGNLLVYYVYIYYNPFNLKPFYVGKGTKRRDRTHLFETWENTTNKIRLSKIINIRARGKEPIIKRVFYTELESEALNYEKRVIQKYGKLCDNTGILCNILDGGKQPPRGVGNPLWKKNNPSTKHKGKSYQEIYGNDRATLIKERRSKSSKGRKFNKDTRKKMSASAKARNRDTQLKKVIIDGVLFNSMKDVATTYNVSQPTVTNRVKSSKWINWNYY